jgi:PhzF family phenazine biosynthesis protein
MHRAKIRATIVDAFTRTAGHGNRAGVVVETVGLDDGGMRAIARAVAASETAFSLPPPAGADLRLRYFTPATEVSFCGHATVATFHRLAETGELRAPGRYQLETAAGRLEVELEPVEGACRVWIATPRHPWSDSPIAVAEAMKLLGGDTAMVDRALPVRRSGPKVFIPLARRDDLWALSPRWDALADAGLEHEVHGFFAFTRDASEPDHVVQGRFFAPALGVREDPVTGAANGPLAEYLALHGVLALPPGGGTARARAEQGDAMGRPGRVDLEVTGSPDRIERARVGGVAVTVMDGVLYPG